MQKEKGGVPMKKTKKQKKEIVMLLILTIVAVVAVITGVIGKEDILAVIEEMQNVATNTVENQETTVSLPVVIDSTKEYNVIKVVDGDTIQVEIDDKIEKIRMIGIDTPESVHPDEEKNTENGKKASEYTKKLLTGKSVTLELDVQERDKYGRILAYVYLNGRMVNKKLLSDGYAKVATFPPNVKYVQEFTKLEEKAREAKKGLWAEE